MTFLVQNEFNGTHTHIWHMTSVTGEYFKTHYMIFSLQFCAWMWIIKAFPFLVLILVVPDWTRWIFKHICFMFTFFFLFLKLVFCKSKIKHGLSLNCRLCLYYPGPISLPSCPCIFCCNRSSTSSQSDRESQCRVTGRRCGLHLPLGKRKPAYFGATDELQRGRSRDRQRKQRGATSQDS